MRRFIIFIFLVTFNLPYSFAQLATISDGVNYRTDDYFEMIGKVGDSYFLVKDLVEGAKIYSFDSYMKLNWENEISTDKKRFDILGTSARKDYFAVIFKMRIKGRTIVRVHKYDEDGALVDSTTVKNYDRRNFSPEPILVRSADKKKFLIWNDREEFRLEATAFDIERMEVIWDKEKSTGKLSLRKELFQVVQDNQGTMYSIFSDGNTRSEKESNKFSILKLNKNVTKLQDIHLESNFIFDSYFDIDHKNNQLVGAGLYDPRKASRASGVFYLKMDLLDTGNHSIKFNVFPEETLTNIKGKETQTGDSFSDVYVNEVIMRSDGGIVMVLERFKQVNQMSTPDFPRTNPSRLSSGGDLREEYHYDDIILAAMDNKGNPEWFDVLFKRQFSRDDNGQSSSFFIMKTANYVRFIYNDEIKSNNKISEYTLLKDGENERNSILDTEGYNVELMFRNSLQINRDEILVPSIKKKSLKLVRIKYG